MRYCQQKTGCGGPMGDWTVSGTTV
jgi:hypothetical protein